MSNGKMKNDNTQMNKVLDKGKQHFLTNNIQVMEPITAMGICNR